MRVKNALMNSGAVVAQKIMEIILSFAFRTILIYTLDTTYLGLSSLFSNIFSLLSLMEMGVGSSIVFLMYKPLNDRNYDEVNALLRVYSRFYDILGILIAIIGFALIPFLPKIIKEYNSLEINLLPIYILTLLNVVFSYFLAYRRSLLEADQKAYVNSINYTFFNFLGSILRIVALLIFKDYVLTLVITFVLTIISNIVIYFKTNSLYSFLKIKTASKITKDKTIELLKRMGASIMHKIGNIVVTSTDNIIISAFIGVTVVGYYSNYSMMTGIIYSMFSLIFTSITANVGNMKLNASDEKSLEIFNRLFFLNFYFYFVSCTCFYVCIDDLIILWIGGKYLLDSNIAFVLTISLFIQGMRHVTVTFINSSGLNYDTRYKAIFEAVINLATSLILVHFLGITGVILGTIISFVTVSVWFEPYILYKKWFKKGLVKYYMKYSFYTILTIVSMIIIRNVFNLLPSGNVLYFIFKAAFSFIAANLIVLLFFFRSNDLKYYYTLVHSFIRRGKYKTK
ncbi:MAG: oligosaccharide flippase family protein [Treponema sp.]|nr:oligosaccharide flippase family protein [Treponema sp.]